MAPSSEPSRSWISITRGDFLLVLIPSREPFQSFGMISELGTNKHVPFPRTLPSLLSLVVAAFWRWNEIDDLQLHHNTGISLS